MHVSLHCSSNRSEKQNINPLNLLLINKSTNSYLALRSSSISMRRRLLSSCAVRRAFSWRSCEFVASKAAQRLLTSVSFSVAALSFSWAIASAFCASAGRSVTAVNNLSRVHFSNANIIKLLFVGTGLFLSFSSAT